MSKLLITAVTLLLCFCSARTLNADLFFLTQSANRVATFFYDGGNGANVDLGGMVSGDSLIIIFDYNDSDSFFDEQSSMLDFNDFKLYTVGSNDPILLSIDTVEPGPVGRYLQRPEDGGQIEEAMEWDNSTFELTLSHFANDDRFDNTFDNDPNNPYVNVTSKIMVRLRASQSLEGLSIDRLTFDGTWDMGPVFANDTINVSSAIASISNSPVSIVSEDCTPPNDLPDPGETVTVALPLMNSGGASTVALTATLQATGGVTAPSGPVNYGAVPPDNVPVSNNFTFTTDPNISCGDSVTLTWIISDGATNYPNVTVTYTTGVITSFISDNMDGVIAPSLPGGWINTQNVGTDINWTTTTTSPFSAPNAAFANDPGTVNAATLSMPEVMITSSASQLSFKNRYMTEASFDGGVLEYSIDGGSTWVDIIDGGGSFVSGGYNGPISSNFMSPIGGRMAWSGNSGGYVDTVVDLPASLNGQHVTFRWMMASDSSVTSTGWWIDDVLIIGGLNCADCQVVQTVFPDMVATTRGAYASGNVNSLATSDNSDYVIQRNGSDTLARTEFVVLGTSQFVNPSSMEVMLEGAVFARSTVVQSIALFNYVTGAWEVIDSRNASNMVDSTATAAANGDLSRFVNQTTLSVEARIRFQSASPRQRFSSNTDMFNWIIGN